MAVKPFQVKMDEQAHKRLKSRAAQFGITIGDMIGNLLASFEFRVRKVYDQIETDGRIDSIYLDNTIVRLLMDKDQGNKTDEQFEDELKRAVKAMRKDQWAPSIKLGEDRPK